MGPINSTKKNVPNTNLSILDKSVPFRPGDPSDPKSDLWHPSILSELQDDYGCNNV